MDLFNGIPIAMLLLKRDIRMVKFITGTSKLKHAVRISSNNMAYTVHIASTRWHINKCPALRLWVEHPKPAWKLPVSRLCCYAMKTIWQHPDSSAQQPLWQGYKPEHYVHPWCLNPLLTFWSYHLKNMFNGLLKYCFNVRKHLHNYMSK